MLPNDLDTVMVVVGGLALLLLIGGDHRAVGGRLVQAG